MFQGLFGLFKTDRLVILHVMFPVYVDIQTTGLQTTAVSVDSHDSQ